MELGPAQDRVLSYSFFNERQLGSGHWARSLGNISTKWGSLMAASFILHHWDFRFRCGGLTYEITIDFSEIQDFFFLKKCWRSVTLSALLRKIAF